MDRRPSKKDGKTKKDIFAVNHPVSCLDMIKENEKELKKRGIIVEDMRNPLLKVLRKLWWARRRSNPEGTVSFNEFNQSFGQFVSLIIYNLH